MASTLYFQNGLLTLSTSADTPATFTPAPPGFAPADPSSAMGCDYIPYDPDHPTATHLEIEEFLGRLFPDPEVNLYVMIFLASCLEYNRNRPLYVLWGPVPGGNGKTTFMDLVQATFGTSASFINFNVLTRKTGSAAVDKVIKEVAGKRIVTMEEIEPQYKINAVVFKTFLSETSTCFYECNVAPTFSGSDESIYRRIVVIPFESRFVHSSVPADPEKHVYLRDPTLHEKTMSKEWRSHFAGLLVYHYQVHYKAGLLAGDSANLGALAKAKEAFTADC